MKNTKITIYFNALKGSTKKEKQELNLLPIQKNFEIHNSIRGHAIVSTNRFVDTRSCVNNRSTL